MMMNDDSRKKKAMMVLAFGKGESKPNPEVDETEQPGHGSRSEELAGNILSAVKNGSKKELAVAMKEMIYHCMNESEGPDESEYQES